MATRDQQRAALAYKHVSPYQNQEKPKKKKYGSMVHSLPALLQTAGLCQALHFVRSRKDDDQKKLVEHLAEHLHRVNPSIKTGDDLLKRAREADLDEYLQLTDEAMACAAWYRRLVQGVLGIEPGDSDDEEDGAN